MNKFQTLLLFCILFAATVFSFFRFDYPTIEIWGEGNQDYMVAHHIIAYKEFPLIGPYNQLFYYGVINSPVYYYIISLFLLLHDSILFLGVVSIFFHLLTILIVFNLVKKIFGASTALLTIALFSFIPFNIESSSVIWQPYLMQPIFYGSIYLLLLAYEKKKYYTFLSAGIVLFLMAMAIHLSASAFIIIYLCLVFIILKNKSAHMSGYLGICLIIILTLMFFYSPVIYFIFKHNISQFKFTFSLNSIDISLIKQYGRNIYENSSLLFETFNFEYLGYGFYFGYVLILIFITSTGFYFYNRIDRKKKNFLAIILFSVLCVTLTISIFPKTHLYYLLLVIAPLCAVFSETVLQIRAGNFFLGVCKVIIIGMFLFLYAGNAFFFIRNFKPLRNFELIQEAAHSMTHQTINSFQVHSYVVRDKIYSYIPLDTILLVPLEQILQKKLVSIKDNAIPFKQINNDAYVFFACYNFFYSASMSKCPDVFLHDYSNYSLTGKVYSTPSLYVYLAKKE